MYVCTLYCVKIRRKRHIKLAKKKGPMQGNNFPLFISFLVKSEYVFEFSESYKINDIKETDPIKHLVILLIQQSSKLFNTI